MTKTFSCYFTDELGRSRIGDIHKISADSPKEAADLFCAQSSSPKPYVFVLWGFGKSEIHENKKIKEAEFDKEIESAGAAAKHSHLLLSEALKKIETKSYFELEVEQRIIFSGYFNDLVAYFEKRSLLPAEIKFIKNWQNLKDRELGESLLAKSEMAKPKDQQGLSPLGKMVMASTAISSMKLSQDIGAVSDQVENISEGIGFEG